MKIIRPPVPVGEASMCYGETKKIQDCFRALPVFPLDRCFDADSSRLGRVALSVLYDPRTSISMTALKALELNCVIGARKFPAAPALSRVQKIPQVSWI